MYILGISGYYHDSAAALLLHGEIIAAAQEERFSRKKHDASFPKLAIEYCLREAGISISEVSYIAFYEKPLIKFERLLETYLAFAPRGLFSFLKAMPVWLKEKILLRSVLKKELSQLSGVKKSKLPPLLFAEHHQAHAASAFFASPFEEAAVLCLDGVGEWATTSVWHGQKNQLRLLWEIDFPHSLGLLYSAFTYYCGFKVNSGEYKLMGLAPYGEPEYVDLIYQHLVDVKVDGTFRLNMDYFDFAAGLKMTNDKFDQIFGGPARSADGLLTQKHMDLACSIQAVTDDILLKLGKTIRSETGCENLCLAGGVALNCVANGRLLREGLFKDIWIQPAAGDAGGALGAAYITWYEFLKNQRLPLKEGTQDHMKGAYLGPAFSAQEIKDFLGTHHLPFEELTPEEAEDRVADLLSKEFVIGWFQGRMEFGPRSLGSRSILGDSRSQDMQSKMNLRIKYRESFRPFAPAVLSSDVQDYFEFDRQSPYMLFTALVKKALRLKKTNEEDSTFGIERLKIPRSTIPSVTHIDFSARLQTVHHETNPKFFSLLQAFKKKTGVAVLVNTSFNVRGEPIVCSPQDAYLCFMRTEMDYLVLENLLLNKSHQPKLEKNLAQPQKFELD